MPDIKNLIETLTEKVKASSETDKNMLQQAVNKLQADQRTIDDLQAQLKKEKEDREKDNTDHEAQRKADRIDYYKRDLFNIGPTIYDELDPEAKRITVSAIIDKTLREKNLEFALNDKDEMQLLHKDGTKVYGANNIIITPKIFVDDILAQNKILKTAENQSPDNTVIHSDDESRTFIPGSNNNNQTVAAINKQNREAYQEGANH